MNIKREQIDSCQTGGSREEGEKVKHKWVVTEQPGGGRGSTAGDAARDFITRRYGAGGRSPFRGGHSPSYLSVQSLRRVPGTNVIVCANCDQNQILQTLWKERKE